LKRALITLLKVALSLAIIAYLVWNSVRAREGRPNVFAELVAQPKQWDLLVASWLVCTAAVVLTLVRWWYLVRALDLPFPMRDALRLGFLGFLFNLAPMGIVGGDLLKAVLLAREHPGNRAKAVASVVADRIIGLYVLFLVAAAAIVLTGFHRLPVAEVRYTSHIIFALTAVGGMGILGLMTPGLTSGRLSAALGRIPRIGHTVEGLIHAMRMYRRQPAVLGVSALMSVAVHCLFVAGIYLIARGLPGDDLSLASHFVIIPVASTTGALPLPLGPFEVVFELLYTRVPEPGVTVEAGQGLVVALGYRLITLLIAAIGMGYYVGSRREVAEVLEEADRQPPETLQLAQAKPAA
jgi:glycosyltransferase 2 family protein